VRLRRRALLRADEGFGRLFGVETLERQAVSCAGTVVVQRHHPDAVSNVVVEQGQSGNDVIMTRSEELRLRDMILFERRRPEERRREVSVGRIDATQFLTMRVSKRIAFWMKFICIFLLLWGFFVGLDRRPLSITMIRSMAFQSSPSGRSQSSRSP
jgi:hypothetical protein